MWYLNIYCVLKKLGNLKEKSVKKLLSSKRKKMTTATSKVAKNET